VTVEPTLEQVLTPPLLPLPIQSPSVLGLALRSAGSGSVTWCGARRNVISQCYLAASGINDRFLKTFSTQNLNGKYAQVCMKSKPPPFPERGRKYIFTLQGKTKRRKKMHNNTCKLIPSPSNWLFIQACTSTTPSQPPAAVSDARTGSTLICEQDFSSLTVAGG